MNPKHSLVFFSGGVILILGFVLMGLIPMSVIPESSQQHNTVESDSKIQQQDNDENIIQREDDDMVTLSQTKPIEDLSCTELKEFAMSFEKGWGSAVALHDEKCS